MDMLGDLTVANPVSIGAGALAATVNNDKDESGDPSKVVDLDAVLVPDYFERLRPYIQADDGSPRLVVIVACRGAAIGAVGMMLSMPHAMLTGHWYIYGGGRCDTCYDEFGNQYAEVYDETGRMRNPVILAFINWLGTALLFLLTAYFPHELVAATALQTGSLARLGAGTKRINARDAQNLRQWAQLLACVSVPPVLFGVIAAIIVVVGGSIYGILSGTITFEDKWREGTLVFSFFLVPAYIFSMCAVLPLSCGWYLSLKIGAALARDDVAEVVARVAPDVLQDDEAWTATIAKPAINLTSTMADLSVGWGRGTGLSFIVCWIFGASRFARLLDMMGDDEPAELFTWIRTIFPCVGFMVAPLIISADVAAVSTQCDQLQSAINDLRLSWESSAAAKAVHDRVFPLQCTLERLNVHQGLGFLVFGRVVDKRTLNMILATVASVIGGLVPLIVAVMPSHQSWARGDEGNACTLDALQKEEVKSIALAHAKLLAGNATCSFNFTIS